MTWAQKRKLLYILGIAVLFLAAAFAFIYPRLSKEPTCSDGKQNGTELGIDCGGGCSRLCPFQAKEPVVQWSRSFLVTGSTYSAVAMIENQNAGAALQEIRYEFRLYDEDNTFIVKREGRAFVSPNGTTPVFEAGIQTGNRVPKRTTFSIIAKSDWTTVQRSISNLPVRVVNQSLSGEATEPRLSATVRNDSPYAVPDLDIIAILYDRSGNAQAVSKTYLDRLERGEKKDIYFTWPGPLGAVPARIDIVPNVNVFNLEI